MFYRLRSFFRLSTRTWCLCPVVAFVKVRGTITDDDACQRIVAEVRRLRDAGIPYIVLDILAVRRISLVAINELVALKESLSNGDGGLGISGPNAELPPAAILRIVRSFGRHDSPEAAFSDLYLTNMRNALKLRAYRRYGT
jgi:hypothetical protein